LRQTEEKLDDKEILDLIRSNNDTVLVSYFPNLYPKFEPLRQHYFKLCNLIQHTFEGLKYLKNDKAGFAKRAGAFWFSSVLFVMLKGDFGVTFEYVWDYFSVAEEKTFFKLWNMKDNAELSSITPVKENV